MITSKPIEQPNGLGHQAAQVADHAINSIQQVGNEVLDSVSGTVQTIHDQAAPLLNRATKQTNALAQLGADAVRHSAQQLRDQASQASESTVNYVKGKPIKTALIIAAAGALLAAIVGLTGRARKRD